MFWTRKKNKQKLIQDKLDLIDFVFTSRDVHSFADLGGVWGVDGGYTFYSLDTYKVSRAVLVDRYFSNIATEQSKKYSQLRLLQGDFGDERIVNDIGQVDTIFLFDILLHQVSPDWGQILEMYAPTSKCLIIYNQQWIGTNSTVRLIDLGEQEYFKNIPHSRTEAPYDTLFRNLHQQHPDQGKLWKDAQNIWQWGITDTDLLTKVASLGFQLQFYKNCGQGWNTKNFENHAFVFNK